VRIRVAEGAPALDVRCFDEIAGRLVDEAGGLAFAYDLDWLAAGMPPLSQSRANAVSLFQIA
jgi:hypothetical protein